MAKPGRFTVFTDENVLRKTDLHSTAPAPGKTLLRQPLGVLNDISQNPAIASLKSQNLPILLQPNKVQAVRDTHILQLEADEEPESDHHKSPQHGLDQENNDHQFDSNVEEIWMESPIIGNDSPMIVSPFTVATKDQPNQSTEAKIELLDDRFFTREYGDVHYAYMRDMELKLKVRQDYMSRQRDISSDMRSVLVDWLVDVNEEYKMSDETLFLAVSLIDRFLSIMSVVRGKLQLVGAAAIFVASKVEEIYPPHVSEFVYITDETYTASQITRMEALLLKNLGFSIGGSHPLAFVRRLGIQADASLKVANMAQYICELSLLSIRSLLYRPSELGAASLVLAMHHVQGNVDGWTQDMNKFANIERDQLQSAIDFLHELLIGAVKSGQQAIPKKHAHRRYSSVSLLPLRADAPTLS